MHYHGNTGNNAGSDLFGDVLNLGMQILGNNPRLAQNLMQAQAQEWQKMNATQNQNKELTDENKDLKIRNCDLATRNSQLLDIIRNCNSRIDAILKKNEELEQQVKNKNGSSEKNGNLNSTALVIKGKDMNTDEKSTTEINEIKEKPEEALVYATKEIKLLKKSSESLINDLKQAKDQNNKLAKEKDELMLELSKTKKELFDCRYQLEEQQCDYRELSKTLDELRYQKDVTTVFLNNCLMEQDRLKEENKNLTIKLDESQKKVVNLERRNNKMDTVKANVIGMKRSHSSQSILAKASKLKNKFNQEQGQKPALENGNMKQI